ncbi:hypothetical protein FRC11_001913 [Ceratobasidium sp. 423]|nr:hypothetical protein FRC11_001913 [Ceratobasidium sp. 423]
MDDLGELLNPDAVESYYGVAKCAICMEFQSNFVAFSCGHLVCSVRCQSRLITSLRGAGKKDPVECPLCTIVAERKGLLTVDFLIAKYTYDEPLRKLERELAELSEENKRRKKANKKLRARMEEKTRDLAVLATQITELEKLHRDLTKS